MSVFVAVRLPADIAADLAAAHSTVPPALTAAHPDLRWVPPQHWHLTLAFLGTVPEVRRADLTQRLARVAARHGSVQLRLAGSGSFGSRVLFMGVDGDLAQLSRLAASVAAAARRAKVPVDERPFRPHLTLARVRGTASLADLAAALGSYRGPSWTVEAIDLLESSPGPVGEPPRYVGLSRLALAGKSR